MAPGAVIGIAEMLVDRRVGGLSLHGLFEQRDRLGNIAAQIMGPAAGIGDLRTVGLQAARLGDESPRLLDILTPFELGVAPIRSDEYKSDIQSLMRSSFAVIWSKKTSPTYLNPLTQSNPSNRYLPLNSLY